MWKDLTLQQKAEIMKMSVANGVTDINDIKRLYDGSVGHKFDNAGRIITLADLPREYVQKYGHINVVTPKGVRIPLSQAYRDYNQTPINVNDVPGLTDYLIKQDQPDIAEQAHISKVAADRKVHQLGEERDKALIGLAAAIIGGGALASGLALAPVATIGSTIGGIAGEKVFNAGYEKLTGNNWGQDVERWTNGYIPAEYGEYLNPGTLVGGIVGAKLPMPRIGSLESNGILSDWLNIKNWKLNSSPIITEENAAAIPDKMWDRAYFQAIKEENISEVQRLRDLHFKVKSNTQILNDRGEPQKIYHGSQSKFYEYKPEKFGSATDSGWYGKGLYGSSSKNIAEDYADPYLYEFYVNSQRPYKIGFWNEEFTPYALDDYSQSSRRTHLAEFFNRTPDDLQRNLLKRWYHDDFFLDRALADMQRHDSVVQSMIGDPAKPKKIRAKYAEIVVPKPEQLKLADAITYDDAGKVIPLSKRDDFNKKDFRYSLLLPILGLGAASATNRFGGHLFDRGGYVSSKSIRDRISKWEGSSMYAPAPDTGKVNRPFSAEEKDFWRAIPDDIKPLLTQDMADALFSTSYNIGAGNFKKRVVPNLIKVFREGTGTLEDITNSMYGTRDKEPKMKGLRTRRATERSLFSDAFNRQYGNSLTQAYHKMYGKPDLSISNDILYNPAQALQWEPIEKQRTANPMQQLSDYIVNNYANVPIPKVNVPTITPIEERVPISNSLPDIAPLLSYLPDQQLLTPSKTVVPSYQPVDLNFNSPYLLFSSKI